MQFVHNSIAFAAKLNPSNPLEMCTNCMSKIYTMKLIWHRYHTARLIICCENYNITIVNGWYGKFLKEILVFYYKTWWPFPFTYSLWTTKKAIMINDKQYAYTYLIQYNIKCNISVWNLLSHNNPISSISLCEKCSKSNFYLTCKYKNLYKCFLGCECARNKTCILYTV